MSNQKSAGVKGIRYVVDKRGHKKSLVIDFAFHKKAVEEFLVELYGHQKIKERKGQPTLSKEEFLKGLKNDGLL